MGLEGARNHSGASPALSQDIPNLRAQVAPQLQYEQSSKTSPQDAEAAPRPHTEQDQAMAVPCGAAWPWHPLAPRTTQPKYPQRAAMSRPRAANLSLLCLISQKLASFSAEGIRKGVPGSLVLHSESCDLVQKGCSRGFLSPWCKGVDRSVKGKAKALDSAYTHPVHGVAKVAGKGCGTKKRVPRGGGASGQAHRVR